jgi:arabinofuranosyltransferase
VSRLDSLLERLSRRPAAALAMSCVLLAALAWSNRFIQDDAFILFQYARRLVEGHGLTWLDGERVEGYTTFLWTLLLGVPFALHLDPVVFAWCAGLLLYAGTLLSAYSLAVTLTGSRGIALLAVWLLGTNHTFSAFATGGLETVMQALFVTASWALGASRCWSRERCSRASTRRC